MKLISRAESAVIFKDYSKGKISFLPAIITGGYISAPISLVVNAQGELMEGQFYKVLSRQDLAKYYVHWIEEYSYAPESMKEMRSCVDKYHQYFGPIAIRMMK